VLLFDELERRDALLDWARAHDTLVCCITNDDFAEVLHEAMQAGVPDRDLLDVNGGVLALELPFREG
jgi:hypothetical protein